MAARCLVLGAAADLYGSDRMLLESVRALREAAIEPVVVLPATGPLVEALQREGAEVHVRPDFALRRRFANPIALAGLLARMATTVVWALRRHRTTQFDFIYSNTQAVVIGPVLRVLFRRPHIWHVHELLDSSGRTSRVLARVTTRGSDRVVCASAAIEANLATMEPDVAKRSTVVLNGLDLGSFLRLPALPTDASARTLTFGVVARIHPWKGQGLVIEALADERLRERNISVTFFGEPARGNEHLIAELRQSAQDLGVASQISFAGFVPDRVAILSGVDVCVVPSVLPEPFSLVCVEAGASARPVIAPAEGGPCEIIADGATGLLFDPRNAKSLADKILELTLSPSASARLGQAARVHVEQHFTDARYRNEISAVFLEVADIGQPTSRAIECS